MWPCFYGLIRHSGKTLGRDNEHKQRDHLEVDSLKFISLDGLYRAGETEGRMSSNHNIVTRVSRVGHH